jgi:hypothetical protein
VPRLALVLATTAICPVALACARVSTQRADGSSASVACATTRYLLKEQPSTIVSNEQHRLYVRALADSCGRQTPVRNAGVRLLGYRARTGSRGRCTLDVKLATGRYAIRLYVHGRRVAHTSVSAIPVVAK